MARVGPSTKKPRSGASEPTQGRPAAGYQPSDFKDPEVPEILVGDRCKMAQESSSVKDAMADYLSLPQWDWTWYVTQTFDDRKCTPYSRVCEHSWRYWLNLVGSEAGRTYGWMFAEKGRSGRLHWHALVHVSANLFGHPKAYDVWEAMFRKYGRNTVHTYLPGNNSVTIEADKMASGVGRYLSKYVAKDTANSDTTWDFGGFMSGREADAAELCSAIGVPTAGL